MDLLVLAFAVVALLALALLAWFVTAYARTLKGIADAFSVLERMDDRMDARIRNVIERIRNRENKGAPPQQPAQRETPDANAVQAEIARMFGGLPPSVPFDDEQPPAEEVVSV